LYLALPFDQNMHGIKFMSKLKQVDIYTDGSCLGNPGPGGYGAIIRYKQHEKELAQGFQSTTNNRMELLAAIVALEHLTEPCMVTLYSDSQYLRQGISQWIYNWKKNGWRTSAKQDVKNKDLWLRLDIMQEKHQITWKWVKGHSGHPENERCDTLAREAAESEPTEIDQGYNLAQG